jgi:peptide chain release factor 1
MKILRSKLYEIEQQKQNAAIAAERKNQVGTGMRKRTYQDYNYPQGTGDGPPDRADSV